MAQPASGSQNAFVGNSGYLVSYPAGYSTQAGFGDKEQTYEIVSFFPGKTPPASAEAPGFVRLEVQPAVDQSGQPISLDQWIALMKDTMQKNGEGFSAVPVSASLPAMKVSISSPNSSVKLYQTVLRGKRMLYMFSSHDEALIDVFTRNLNEGPSEKPGR